MITIQLTDEEKECLDNYIFRKLINLENSNLTDAICYELLSSIRRKLQSSSK